jgi:hypothetical protein
MIKKILSIGIIGAIAFSFLLVDMSYAEGTGNPAQSGAESARGNNMPSNLFGDSGMFSQISNVLLYIIGAVAVIMIVIGGLRYVISGGDSNQITAAKNTILYAVIGLIVAMLAYAVIGFVLDTFSGAGGAGTNV